MKASLLALCISLGFLAQAQSFRWNDETATTTEDRTADRVDHTGLAKCYPDYYEGNPTALGEVYQQQLMTAAHKKLPLGSIVKVTRLDNGLTTTVRINDRGAYCDGCVIDLSKAAAQQLELLDIGQTRVKLTVIGSSSTNPTAYGMSAGLANERQFTRKGISSAAPTAQKPQPLQLETNPNPYRVRQEMPPSPTTAAPPPGPIVNPSSYDKLPPRAEKQPGNTSPTSINVIDVPISPFAVQLGAYSKYANAERHVLNLQQQGFNNIFLLKEPGTDGPPLNRVIVAPFLSVDDAQEYVEDLADYHQIKGLVFQAKLVEVEED